MSLGVWRARIELKSYFRKVDAVVFTFAYPIIMLLIFGTIFKGDVPGTNVDFRQEFATGIAATGIMNIGFQAMAISIANDRSLGLLKRLRGLPMPKFSYFLGKLLQVLIAGALQTTVLLFVSATLFHLQMPTTTGRWLTLIWVFLLGMTACATLGIALSSLPKDGRTASAVVLPPFLILQFISGVFFPLSQIPTFLQRIAGLFPLKWMCQGLRSVFLPDSFQHVEPAGSWEHPMVALALAGWTVGALAVALFTFRWKDKYEG